MRARAHTHTHTHSHTDTHTHTHTHTHIHTNTHTHTHTHTREENFKTLFYTDCSLGSVKNLTTKREREGDSHYNEDETDVRQTDRQTDGWTELETDTERATCEKETQTNRTAVVHSQRRRCTGFWKSAMVASPPFSATEARWTSRALIISAL